MIRSTMRPNPAKIKKKLKKMQKNLVVSKKSIIFAPNLKFDTITIRFYKQIYRTK